MIQGTHNALDDARNETVKIFINGELIVRKDAKISVFDSGYLSRRWCLGSTQIT